MTSILLVKYFIDLSIFEQFHRLSCRYPCGIFQIYQFHVVSSLLDSKLESQ